MGFLILLLVLTNLATLGAVGWLVLRPSKEAGPDEVVAAAVDATPASGAGTTRRVISIEILNPIELAGTRSRMAGIAGSFVPGLTRRIVYERALKQIRKDIRAQGVLADVRLHTIRPMPRDTVTPLPTVAAQPPMYVDEVAQLDFNDVEDRGA